MKKLTVGIIAHVDAGKTTLTEALLYQSGMIRRAGRVDNRDSFLDTETLERRRGVTIVSKQAVLDYPEESLRVTIIDTPGHADFRADAERVFSILDAAVFIISAADGIDSDTVSLFQLLDSAAVPVIIFINKTDQMKYAEETEEEFKQRVTVPLVRDLEKRIFLHGEAAVLMDGGEPDYESAAACDEAAMEEFFETGILSGETISGLIANRRIVPVYSGSALKMTGTGGLLEGMKSLARTVNEAGDRPEGDFGAVCYRIAKDDKGNRLTFVKVTSGSIAVRSRMGDEKINQIRLYSGGSFSLLDRAENGDVVAFTGLSGISVGEGLGIDPGMGSGRMKPVLCYGVIPPEGLSDREFLPMLRELEAEEPVLSLSVNKRTGRTMISCMGAFQLEIIRSMIRERFGITVEFDEGDVVYKETIAAPSYGVGHFEPLRHYAEVHLLLEPLPEGMGIRVGTDLSYDRLGAAFQRIVLDELSRDRLYGVLTGSKLTDVKITLVAGKSHVKHSESYDFRHAARRAVRQALMKTENVLLEPVFRFTIHLPTEYVGRVMNDLDSMSGQAILSESSEERAVLVGYAPAVYMRNYQSELTRLTAGRGRIELSFGGYKKCHNTEKVVEEYGYDPEADRDNPSGSVFTEHGAGKYVSWDETDARAHVESRAGELIDQEDAESDAQSQEGGEAGGKTGEKSLMERLDAIGYEEVEAILSKTLGANKKNDPLEKRHTYKQSSGRQEAVSQKSKPAGGRKASVAGAAREKYLLVDGYNMIYAWDELRGFAPENMTAARDLLLDILSEYRAICGINLIVVFDAYKVPGHGTELFDYHQVHVVYTRQAETADQYIEKFALEKHEKYDISVATNDGMIQLIIFGAGARRLSAADLWNEVQAARDSIQGYLSDVNR